MRAVWLFLNFQGQWLPHFSSAVWGGVGGIPGDTELTQALRHGGAYDRQTFLA